MAIFTLKMRLFVEKKRSKFGRGADGLHNVLDYRGNICYIPGGSNRCFANCSVFLLDFDYKIEIMENVTQI